MTNRSALHPPSPNKPLGGCQNWKITTQSGTRYGCYWVRPDITGGVTGFETKWLEPGMPRSKIARILRETRHFFRSTP